MRTLSIPLAVAGVLATLAVAASGATQHKQKFVKVRDDLYAPTKVTIKLGDRVKWGWGDGTDHQHTVTEQHGKWTSKEKTIGSFKHTFGKTGTFKIYCADHPLDMRMKVIVTG
jgi:plastocyanin